MVRWLRWHCPPDTGFEIRALAVWGRARYLSVKEAPHNTNFHTWMGKKQICFFQTAEAGNRTPDSGVKGSGANHYPRAPARHYPKARCWPKHWVRWHKNWANVVLLSYHSLKQTFEMKWMGFRPLLCTYRLNWARRTSCGWWDEWNAPGLQI